MRPRTAVRMLDAVPWRFCVARTKANGQVPQHVTASASGHKMRASRVDVLLSCESSMTPCRPPAPYRLATRIQSARASPGAASSIAWNSGP